MIIESEKVLERKLNLAVKKAGGWSIKLLSSFITGLPDRLCLLPKGKIFFAEIKTTKQKPKKIQLLVHKKIEAMGFKVYIIESSEGINKLNL